MLAQTKPFLDAGLRLRQSRERLGLTYRDVERASYTLSERHGRSEFILHISRIADIENRSVVPGLHKLYSLATIYHLNPVEVCGWYEVPLADYFRDGSPLSARRTHVAAPPATFRVPLRFDPGFDPRRTAYLSRMVEQWGHLEGALFDNHARYRYGYVGMEDRRMDPLLRPGSLVQVDPALRVIRNHGWNNEFERPIFLVDVRTGYRCCWFLIDGTRLVLQPHPLSPCFPEVWHLPAEAEVVGQVVGVVTRPAFP
jgi:transcriptional regulator with XRE-family HTH domain